MNFASIVISFDDDFSCISGIISTHFEPLLYSVLNEEPDSRSLIWATL